MITIIIIITSFIPSNYCCFLITTFLVNMLFIIILLLIFIIIIIMLHHQHGYPWPSPATNLYCPSLPVGLQGYILYRHRAIACRSSWSSYLCSSMWRSPQEYVSYEFSPTLPAVSSMSGSSYLDSFRDGW